MPFKANNLQPGDTPSVLAMSWGNGDAQRDDITLVFLDHEGRLRDQTRIDNLITQTSRDEFYDLLQRRRPEVIVVGGFTAATAKLRHGVNHLVNRVALNPALNMGHEWEEPLDMRESMGIDVIYTPDDVARIFQRSQRAELEFGSLWPLAKYCASLARYVQNPLAEFAALGSDIAAIVFHQEFQHLVGHFHSDLN
jgi:transcription elongation factor SPT6